MPRFAAAAAAARAGRLQPDLQLARGARRIHPLKAMLPCKPDKARAGADGRPRGRADVLGCEAGGATFAVLQPTSAIRCAASAGQWRARRWPTCAAAATAPFVPPAPCAAASRGWRRGQRPTAAVQSEAAYFARGARCPGRGLCRRLGRVPQPFFAASASNEPAAGRTASPSSWPSPSPTSSRRCCAPSRPRWRPRSRRSSRSRARPRPAGRRLLPRLRRHQLPLGTWLDRHGPKVILCFLRWRWRLRRVRWPPASRPAGGARAVRRRRQRLPDGAADRLPALARRRRRSCAPTPGC